MYIYVNTIKVSRCVDIGKFRLKGNVQRRCLSGQWLGVTPKCEGLSQFYDYARKYDITVLRQNGANSMEMFYAIIVFSSGKTTNNPIQI